MEITRDEDCGVANEGQKFFVLTDNGAVAWLRNFKDPTGRQAWCQLPGTFQLLELTWRKTIGKFPQMYGFV